MFKFGACDKSKMRGEHHGPLALLKGIDLTDEQLEKLAELKLEGVGKFAQGKSSMIGFFQQLGKELSKEQIDKSKVKEIAKQMQAKKAEFIDSMVDRVLTFADVLTYEQRKQLRSTGIKCFLGMGQTPAPEME